MGLLSFLPKVNNFLCCLSLHTGLIISGISFLVWNILIILQNENIINLKVKGKRNWWRAWEITHTIIFRIPFQGYDHYGGADTTTVCAIAIIFSICLLIGVSNVSALLIIFLINLPLIQTIYFAFL